MNHTPAIAGYRLNLYQRNQELLNENEWPNEPPSAKQQPAEHGPRKTPHRTRPPQITKTKPNEDTKRPGAKNPHEPHPLWRPTPIPLPPDSNPVNEDPRMTSCRTRPPRMTKTNEAMKRCNAENPHKPHPLWCSSDPMACTYPHPIPLPLVPKPA
ncbi:hypothetical protein BS47DRAFT_1361919 [Hydnum rufescens UP504]|uniref:Uncharacterized protein n=1 Tax=Hydnum rufescens UP504 TaxID=1448309 RepID=A0A9P6AYA7_9AGAM|nr:hypothetical protein BS47DRAFT_1361919 [Hydnum rufescens UP504]